MNRRSRSRRVSSSRGMRASIAERASVRHSGPGSDGEIPPELLDCFRAQPQERVLVGLDVLDDGLPRPLAPRIGRIEGVLGGLTVLGARESAHQEIAVRVVRGKAEGDDIHAGLFHERNAFPDEGIVERGTCPGLQSIGAHLEQARRHYLPLRVRRASSMRAFATSSWSLKLPSSATGMRYFPSIASVGTLGNRYARERS